MHTRIGIVVALVCVASVCNVAFLQQTKSLKVTPTSGPLKGKEVYAHSFALVIGVNDYPKLPSSLSLRFAVRDAIDLAEVLVRNYGFPQGNVVLLLNEQATREGIVRNLEAMVDKARFGKDDRVLVFFSGHGATASLPEGGEMGFLVPYDANVDPNKRNAYEQFNKSCVPMKEVWHSLDECPSKHVLVLADACYSGLLATPKDLPGLGDNPVVLAHADTRAVQIMTAGRRGQKSFERTDLGHGAFSYSLIKELKKRAGVPGQVFTTTGLYAAVQEPVTTLTKGAQTPILGHHNDTEGEFLFITTAPQSPPDVPGPDAPRWTSLYNGKDLTGWRVVEGEDLWQARGGTLAFTGDGPALLLTEREYGDFVLRVDWRIPPRGNGGIFMRVQPPFAAAPENSMEVQLVDDLANPRQTPAHATGSIANAVPARRRAARPVGQWNTFVITCNGPEILIVLNGVEALRTTQNQVTPGPTKPLRDRPYRGFVGLQSYNSPGGVEYRNLFIRELD